MGQRGGVSPIKQLVCAELSKCRFVDLSKYRVFVLSIYQNIGILKHALVSTEVSVTYFMIGPFACSVNLPPD